MPQPDLPESFLSLDLGTQGTRLLSDAEEYHSWVWSHRDRLPHLSRRIFGEGPFEINCGLIFVDTQNALVDICNAQGAMRQVERLRRLFGKDL